MNIKNLLLLVLLLPLTIEAEPFPEHLKHSSLILICSSATEEWIVTWGMATEWFPDETPARIVFNDGKGRETVLPTPKEYRCNVLMAKKK